TFFVLTSVYFLLAYIPYTNFFLIQAPPYPWVTWFARGHSILYWVVIVMLLAQFRDLLHKPLLRWTLAVLTLIGLWFTFFAPLRLARTDWQSYGWSVAILVPLILLQTVRLKPRPGSD